MSKGLEALERLFDNKVFISLGRIQGKKQFANDVNIIEKELKEYESYRGFLDNVEKGIVAYTPRDTWEEERKKLKALEIIKEKQVNVFIFLHSGDLQTYNDMVEDNRKLIEEEYNSIKEVLL